MYPLGFWLRQGIETAFLARTVGSRRDNGIQKNRRDRRFFWCTRWGSNPERRRRRPIFYPIRLRIRIFLKATLFYYFFARFCKRFHHAKGVFFDFLSPFFYFLVFPCQVLPIARPFSLSFFLSLCYNNPEK